MFLLLIDAHLKWLDVHCVQSATSAVTMDKLRSSFATHGIPNTLVTDNGSVFTSEEFGHSLKQNGIQHVRAAPYHPSSNGLVAVQTFKNAIKKSATGELLECRLAKFLFNYRTTPHTTTGKTTAELLMGRSPRTCLHKILPEEVEKKQNMQKKTHDKNVKRRSFLVGDSVMVRNFGSGSKWIAGKVSNSRAPVSLQVQLTDGRSVHRHFDHVRSASRFLVPCQDQPKQAPVSEQDHAWADTLTTNTEEAAPQEKVVNVQPADEPEPPPILEEQAVEPVAAKLPVLRRSTRERHPPERL